MKSKLILASLFLMLLCSCSSKDTSKNQNIDTKGGDNITPSAQVTTKATDTTNSSNLDTKDFVEIKNSILPSNLITKKNEGQNPYPINITGEYDLDTDNKPDKIEIIFNSTSENDEHKDSTISINGIKKVLEVDVPTTAWIIDLDKNETDKQFIIADNETEEYIGQVGLHKIDWKNRISQIGIVIGRKDFLGKGIGTEAIELLQYFAFYKMNLNKLELSVHEFNLRAINCYKKCGFVEEGRLRQKFYFNGKYSDSIIMGILRSEYEEKKSKIKSLLSGG